LMIKSWVVAGVTGWTGRGGLGADPVGGTGCRSCGGRDRRWRPWTGCVPTRS
jgi:hypothetical protein